MTIQKFGLIHKKDGGEVERLMKLSRGLLTGNKKGK
jgi:hypothetical protein